MDMDMDGLEIFCVLSGLVMWIHTHDMNRNGCGGDNY